MMPMSHRIGTDAMPAKLASGLAAPARRANSGTVVIAVATTFALLSALISLLPDRAAIASDDLAQAPLRGTLPAIAGTP